MGAYYQVAYLWKMGGEKIKISCFLFFIVWGIFKDFLK